MRSLMSPTGMGEVVVQVTFDHVLAIIPQLDPEPALARFVAQL